MTTGQWTDQEWQQKITLRDAGAWQTLDQQIERWLTLYAQERWAWMDRGEQCEFIAHCKLATIEQIFTKVEQYQGRGPFLGWCRVVMLNVTRDQVRQDRRQQKWVASGLEIDLLPQTQDETPIDAVEKALVREQIAPHLTDAIATALTEQERRIFAAGWDRSAKAVAAELGMAANNVDQLRFQARQKLRRFLEKRGLTRQLLVEWGLLPGNFRKEPKKSASASS